MATADIDPWQARQDAADEAMADRIRAWQPIPLRPYLDGTVERPEATIGFPRIDGKRLLYRGKEHVIIGEMESGKSWFSLACCASEISAGNHVVYIHFEESDPTFTVERLQQLGLRDTDIEQRFRFVGPDQPVIRSALIALLDPAPTLVVLDGVNEAMSLHGMGIREEDGAAAYRRELVKPCCAAGAAVLSDDHVAKNRETRGRYGLGSVHKGNGIDGTLIMLDNVAPFGRGMRGMSRVYINKDRPGTLRQHGKPGAGQNGSSTYMGDLVIDDRRTKVSFLDIQFYKPKDDDPQDSTTAGRGPSADVQALVSAVRDLRDKAMPASGRQLRVRTGWGKDRFEMARTAALLDGVLTEVDGERRSRLLVPVEPEREGS